MTPSERQAAEQRIRRLKAAIGAGPHSRTFRALEHIQWILDVIGDQAALELLKAR